MKDCDDSKSDYATQASRPQYKNNCSAIIPFCLVGFFLNRSVSISLKEQKGKEQV